MRPLSLVELHDIVYVGEGHGYQVLDLGGMPTEENPQGYGLNRGCVKLWQGLGEDGSINSTSRVYDRRLTVEAARRALENKLHMDLRDNVPVSWGPVRTVHGA